MTRDQPVGDVVHALEDAVEKNDQRVGDVLDEFGRASISSALLVVSLLLVSPLSGVPFFTSICGIIIALIAGQGALARERIWLPRMFAERSVSGGRIRRGIAQVKRFAGWIDRNTEPRMSPLVSPPASRVLYTICGVAGLSLPALELVPFSSSLIGVGLSLISASLLVRDGLVALLGLLVLPMAALIPVGIFLFVTG